MHTIRRNLHIALTSQPRENHFNLLRSDLNISNLPIVGSTFELLGAEATSG